MNEKRLKLAKQYGQINRKEEEEEGEEIFYFIYLYEH